MCNSDDRRQWRKQGGAVGAAASRMQATAQQTLGAATRSPYLRRKLPPCLPALRYQCVAMFLQPVIIVTNMMFQSIGKSGRATFLACCRQGVCFIPLILTLPRIWGLSGIELCQPIADGLTFCISVPFLLPFLKELKEEGDEE